MLPARILKICIPTDEEENAFNVFLILNTCMKRLLSEKDIVKEFFYLCFVAGKEIMQ